MSGLDTRLFFAMNQFAGQNCWLDGFFIFMAQYSPIILAIFLVWQYFTRKQLIQTRKTIWLSLLSFVVAEAAAKVMGLFYSHPQPFVRLTGVHLLIPHAVDNAFPSDHSLLFFSIMGIFCLVKKEQYRWTYLLIATVVAISRIWVGVHSPIDALGGAIIGITSAYLVRWLNIRLKKVSIWTSRLSLYFFPHRFR